MFRIKICGITSVLDADIAAEEGADAIGLNFYERSPRYVQSEKAMKIAMCLSDRAVERIGVYVNAPIEAFGTFFVAPILTGLQFHGNESPEEMARVVNSNKHAALHGTTQTLVVRARRMGEQGIAAIAKDLADCQTAGCAPSAVLVDAMTPGQYGGTGETLPWHELADHRRWLGDTPLILAGGLTPDNVAEAIRIVRPAAVDVASGVESAPGKKDPIKVRDFIAAAKSAFG